MLSLWDPCSRMGRRAFLRIGTLGLGGFTLPQLFAAREASASFPELAKDKSVIFLFLHGGPSQTETFDPKMSAPAEVRSATGELSTKLPGITFGGTFPRLAGLADRVTIVRSFRTGDANHDIKPVMGQDTLGANMGSLYARVAGTNHPRTGMPRNMVLLPRAVDASTQPGNMNFGRFDAAGTLGAAYAPLVPGAGGSFQESMQLAIPRSRLDDRWALLQGLDRLRAQAEGMGLAGLDRFQQQAFETIVGGVAQAFDWTREAAEVRERYDTAPLVRPEQISRRWNNYHNYVDNAKSLGKLLLLARRLCEAGCGFVTVTTNFVWDMHADQNNAGVEEGMQYMGHPLDHAVSALIEDLEARGLRDKVLLVVTGEMGRTPRINKNGGRDHWGGLTPLLLYGGGLAMGQIIGQSTADAGEPRSEPFSNRHLLSTIMHSLLNVGEVRIARGLPNDVVQVISGSSPITGLLS